MSPGRFRRVLCAAALLVPAAAGTAAGQAVTPAPVPGGEYDALGLRAGGFVMFPSIDTGFVVSDNVTEATQDERTDAGYYVAPAMRIESDWVRHAVSLDASSRHVFYFSSSSENTTDFDLRGNYRLDVLRSTTLDFGASYALTQEGRGEIDVPGAAAEPPNEHTITGSGKLTHRFNRLEVSVDNGVSYRIFDDVDLIGGGVQNNSDRSYTEVHSALRLGYEISPKVKPFVRGEYSVRLHDKEVDDNGLRRNSDGVTVEAGLQVEFSAIFDGEVSLGYVHRDFDDAALENISGVTFNGRLNWRPTALTTVSFNASTEVEETGAGNLSGSFERRFGVSVNHRLRHNVVIGGSANYTFEDYVGGGLEEETLYLAAGLTYQLNRAMALRFGYSFKDFSSNIAGRDYQENRIQVGLLIQK